MIGHFDDRRNHIIERHLKLCDVSIVPHFNMTTEQK